MRSAQQGFTLVEMLVAVALFGLITLSGIALLDFSARAQGAATARFDRLDDIQRFDALFTADLLQALPRRTRDPDGSVRAAFTGNDSILLGFVRGGAETDDDDPPRPALQRVAYRFANGRLERQHWPMLDGAAPESALTVLAGARKIVARYHYRGHWHARWDSRLTDTLPDAIELTIDLGQRGALRQLFLVGAAG